MANNILILGGGGREHAIAKALKASKNIKHISCAPGNPGITKDASCHLTDPTDLRSVLDLAKRIKPDLVIIGPEAPLAMGIADALRRYQYLVFGPNQRSALLESSKVFAKNFMIRHGIPTAGFKVCSQASEVLEAASALPAVIKADGLAAGKGVRICQAESDLKSTLKDFFEKKILGTATDKVLVEEYISGEEMSVLVLTAGGKYEILPVAQDYKRLQNANEGPNTGGMGAYAPLNVNSKLLSKISEKIIAPTMKGLVEEKLDYPGILYFGLMIKEGEPYLLEYNVRFGDPETQVILPLLDGDWAQVFTQVAKGSVPKLKWKNIKAVCIVLAAPGYPENPQKGLRLVIDKTILPKLNESCYVLHAGTASHNGYITSGGRVLNIVGVNKNGAIARAKAYEVVPGILLEGMLHRTDIAAELGEYKLPETKQIVPSSKKTNSVAKVRKISSAKKTRPKASKPKSKKSKKTKKR